MPGARSYHPIAFLLLGTPEHHIALMVHGRAGNNLGLVRTAWLSAGARDPPRVLLCAGVPACALHEPQSVRL